MEKAPLISNRRNPALDRARKLVAALRAAKDYGPLWTAQQCGLLTNLCIELGVDAPEHAELVKAGHRLVLAKSGGTG
jgi:hypothetical protein